MELSCVMIVDNSEPDQCIYAIYSSNIKQYLG